jgi:hypothetical protein
VKAETGYESTFGAWESLSRLKAQGTTLFAATLAGFLLILIGLPVAMVVLMSLRTGFPGETVPFTLENFSDVYLTPRTYEILRLIPREWANSEHFLKSTYRSRFRPSPVSWCTCS